MLQLASFWVAVAVIIESTLDAQLAEAHEADAQEAEAQLAEAHEADAQEAEAHEAPFATRVSTYDAQLAWLNDFAPVTRSLATYAFRFSFGFGAALRLAAAEASISPTPPRKSPR
jgi:hypothetical protein